MTECSRCGDCCRAVGLIWSQEFVRDHPDLFGERFRRWVVEELRPISAPRVFQLLPAMAELDVEDPAGLRGRHFFECTNFDAENNLCLAHDTRPDTCAGFPWYGEAPRFDLLRPYPRCSFHADVGALELHITRGSD